MKTLTDIISRNEKLYQQEALILEATELLSSIMQDCGISKSDLAGRLGTSKAHVTQCLSGRQNMTLRTLADFCTALEYEFKLGAEPLCKDAQAPMHRLYAIGTWVVDMHQCSQDLITDCAALESSDPGSELCNAA